MDGFKQWLSLAIPAGWEDVIVRTVKVLLVAFAVMHLKEWLDAGMFDSLEILVDAAWIAGGILVFNAILLFAKR